MPTPPPPPRRHPLRTVVLLALSLALAALVGISVGRFAWNSSPDSTTRMPLGNIGSNQQGSGSDGPANAASIAAAVDPGLVDINTTLGYQSAEAAGTGIVLTSSGEVLTNNHVIAGATQISATDIGNGRTYTATVVGYDRTDDIAVLQLQNASGLATVSTGDSAKVSVGDQVVALGNAGGRGGTPATAPGTVTALNQAITASDDEDNSTEQLTGLIQVDADVQPGDSGGPLVNTSNKVIGIDTAASQGFRFQQSGNAGFAIPINTAMSIARQITGGHASATVHLGATAFLGVEVSQAGGNGSADGQSGTGVSVAGVLNNSPAQQAGLAVGDTIVSLDGSSITSPNALSQVMSQHHPGDRVTLGWLDQAGQQHTATVQLVAGPAA